MTEDTKSYIPDSVLDRCSVCVFVWDDCFSLPSVWCRLGRTPEECDGPNNNSHDMLHDEVNVNSQFKETPYVNAMATNPLP